ncbi:hypothetical protein V1277_002281 [Bradyrhizobium sp. AZCC 1588]
MPGLVPGIHAFTISQQRNVCTRAEPAMTMDT